MSPPKHFKWAEAAITLAEGKSKCKHHQKRMAQCFDTQKYVQPLDDPPKVFENVQYYVVCHQIKSIQICVNVSFCVGYQAVFWHQNVVVINQKKISTPLHTGNVIHNC